MRVLLTANSAVNFVCACYCLNFVALIDAIFCRRFLCHIESWRRQLSRWIWTGHRARKCCLWGGFSGRMLRPLYSSVGLMALCIFRAWWRWHHWCAQCSMTWFSAGGCKFTCLMKTSRPSRRAAMRRAQHLRVMKLRFCTRKIACCVTQWRIKRGCNQTVAQQPQQSGVGVMGNVAPVNDQQSGDGGMWAVIQDLRGQFEALLQETRQSRVTLRGAEIHGAGAVQEVRSDYAGRTDDMVAGHQRGPLGDGGPWARGIPGGSLGQLQVQFWHGDRRTPNFRYVAGAGVPDDRSREVRPVI